MKWAPTAQDKKHELKKLILNGISTEELKKYNYSDITNMSYTFRYCESLKSAPLFDTDNVTYMRFMFRKYINLEHAFYHPDIDYAGIKSAELKINYPEYYV